MAHAKMPFVKYKDYYLIDIPEHYYTWCERKGFPNSRLGTLMVHTLDIKIMG